MASGFVSPSSGFVSPLNVEKRVSELRHEIDRLDKISDIAYQDIDGLFKRRERAVQKLITGMQTTTPPSEHVRSFRAQRKMSKQVYAAGKAELQEYFKEKYAKTVHLLKTDVSDCDKAILDVTNYYNAVTAKAEALVAELGTEYSSDAWTAMTNEKMLRIERAGTAVSREGEASRGRPKSKAAAKAKAKAPPRGRSGSAGARNSRGHLEQELVEAPPTPPDLMQLPNFHEMSVKTFQGPWSVSCGHMRAEANVSAKGQFDMHQTQVTGQPGGWSALRCHIEADNSLGTFVADIDTANWKMVTADINPNGKSVIIWESGDKPSSIWTRTNKKRPADKPAAKPPTKAKAKTQVRRSPIPSAPVTPDSVSTGSNPGPGTEWYTEVRDGRLMWTDGISMVPADDRLTDDNRQKTKMQF